MVTPTNRWPDVEHALAYLAKADDIPHRAEGTAVLVELLPERVTRVLDLGTGDGRLLDLVLTARPGSTGLGLDFNDAMLERARERFAGDDHVTIERHDLDDPLPGTDTYDLIVSSFAIHHVSDERKRGLYRECFDRLDPGGTFLNLEHVASPTDALHLAFLDALDIRPEDDDPSNLLAPWRTSSTGCGRPASETWTATGSGGSWPCWRGADRRASDGEPHRVARAPRLGDARPRGVIPMPDSGPQAAAEGVVEEVKGRVKEAAGSVVGNRDLKEEGEAQQRKADAEREVAEHEAEAEKARADSEAHEAEERAHQD